MPATIKRNIAIIGCGNIGRAVAQLYQAQGTQIFATVQSNSSDAHCRALNLNCQRLNLDRDFSLSEMPPDTRLLYTIPPPRSGTEDSRIAAFLEKLSPQQIEKFVLISTTGVYGDCQGEWVDEQAILKPRADRARRRADAEIRMKNWAAQHNIAFIILRVPGIYSPARLPLKRLQAGTPVLRCDQAPWTNRIHADDLASICVAALNADIDNEIINVADDAPGSMTDYFNAVADYAGLPRPPQINLSDAQQSLSAGMLSYIAESRRVDNKKMKRLLNIQLRYPSLKDGLKR